MSSAVQICNRGLSWAGLATITSLTGEEPEAKQCNLHYADCLRSMLASHPWKFAQERVTLAALETNTRVDEWLYEYHQPNNMLRLHWVNDASIARTQMLLGDIPTAPYEVGGTSIWSDVENAVCQFTGLIEDPSLFPIHFQEGLSWEIASNVVIALTEDNRRVAFIREQADMAMSKAMQTDGNLDVDDSDQPPRWITDRGATDFQRNGYESYSVPYYRRRV